MKKKQNTTVPLIENNENKIKWLLDVVLDYFNRNRSRTLSDLNSINEDKTICAICGKIEECNCYNKKHEGE